MGNLISMHETTQALFGKHEAVFLGTINCHNLGQPRDFADREANKFPLTVAHSQIQHRQPPIASAEIVDGSFCLFLAID